MSNTVKAEQKKTTLEDPGIIGGAWELTYKLVNQLQNDGFSGRVISGYSDALTGQFRPFVDGQGKPHMGFMIDKVRRILQPEKDRNHRAIVDWLIGHPLVGVVHPQDTLDNAYLRNKESNPRILLKNLDYEELVSYDEDDYIDKLIGRISKDTGQDSIGFKKLQWILAKLNLSYRNSKYIKQVSVHKKHLRNTLKKYVRKSMNNAKRVNQILAALDEAKLNFELKEMLRVNMISIEGGMYMHQGHGLGISQQSVYDRWQNAPDLYAEMTDKLYVILKRESEEK